MIYLQSAFLTDCFFFEGLEMTFIRLLGNKPSGRPEPYNIFTFKLKCFCLSESDIYKFFAAQKPCKKYEDN